MATDLREQQGRTLRQEAIRPGRIESGPRWPFVAAGVVLVVLAAVAVLVFTEGRQQPVFGAGHWAETVEGMNTGAREARASHRRPGRSRSPTRTASRTPVRTCV